VSRRIGTVGAWATAVALLFALVTATQAAASDAVTGTKGQSVGSATAPVRLIASTAQLATPTSIAWGDGQEDQCVAEPSSPPYPRCGYSALPPSEFPYYSVMGYHTYAEQDSSSFTQLDVPYKYTVTTSGASASGTATIADAPITGSAKQVTELVGAASQTAVASFSSADPNVPASAFTATISWGDGSAVVPNATITPSGSGFVVQGSHAYATAGTYPVKVTVQDTELFRVHAPGITLTGSAVVSSSGAENLTLQEGVPFSVLVAQFCSPPHPPTSAAIDWGDGTATDTSSAAIQHNGSDCYQVSAHHTYADGTRGHKNLTVTVSPNAGGPAPATGGVDISDGPLSATINAAALSGSSLTLAGGVLARVTDADTTAPPCVAGGPCDLTAQVGWGDGGADQAATVSPDPNGGLDVIAGPHNYSGPGKYTITITLTDVGGSSTRVQGVYTINPPPKVAAGCKSPVPGVGATAGRYGQALDPGAHPNWGLSTDDRVLRFGNLVICAVDHPWTYEGDSSSASPVSGGGVFVSTGRMIVNGIELVPVDQGNASLTVDTAAASFSGPREDVSITPPSGDPFPAPIGVLGIADLPKQPWILQGGSLASVLPGFGAGDKVQGLALSGPSEIDVTGLGRSTVSAHAQLPARFTLQPYGGAVPTTPLSVDEIQPGLAAAATAARLARVRERQMRRARTHSRTADEPLAHAADDGCSYPDPTAPIRLTAPDLYLGGVEMHCAYVVVDPKTGEEDGGGGFGFGPVYVNGFFGFKHGSFEDAGGGVDGLNAPVFPGVTLDSAHFGVFLDPTRFSGSLGLGLGGGLAELNGGALTVFATDGHPYTYNADASTTGQDDIPGTASIGYGKPFTTFATGAGGTFSPLGLPLPITGYALYVYPAYFEFGGGLNFSVLGGAVTANGSILGQFWLGSHSFNIEGNENVCVTVIGCNGAHAIISSRGLIGCWHQSVIFGTISVGGGYVYGDSLPSIYFHACSDHYGPYRVTGGASEAAGGARRFRLPPGLPNAMIRVSGGGDSPAFTITGPHGEHASTGADDALAGGGAFALMRSHRFDSTWIGISHPAGGAWALTPEAGSAPISGISVANGMPPASVHARVTGRGHARLLHYRIRPRPGQTVQFIEQGRGVSKSLGTVHRVQGTLPFSPAVGAAGRRQILALVSIGAVPSARLAVAAYRAPATLRAGRARHLRLQRRHGSLLVSWSPGANTHGSRVVLITTDGRRELFTPPAHHLTVPDFAFSGALVTVLGVGPDGNLGAPAAARLAALARPARVTGQAIRRHGSLATVSWRRAARAVSYRVTVILSGGEKPITFVTVRHALRIRLPGPRATATVTVRGQGASRVLGRATTAHLTTPKPPRRHHT
jgi:hypothetical protein